MMKLFRWITALVALALLAIAIGLALLQIPWTKQKITDLIFEAARKEGFIFTVGSIEGDPPFKWTLKNVHINLNETDTLNIDTLRLRIAILPLLRRELSISYLSADEVVYRFFPSPVGPPKLLSLPVSLAFKSVKIDRLSLENLETKTKNLFTAQGKGRVKRKGKSFFFEGKISNAELNLELSFEGNKKSQHIASSLYLDVQSPAALAPFGTIPVEGAFTLESTLQGPWKAWQGLLFPKPDALFLKPLKGQIKANLRRVSELDSSALVDASFSLFSDRSLDVDAFALKSDFLCFKGKGKLDPQFYPKSLSFSFLLPHLSHLIPNLGGIVSGDGLYDGHAAMLSLSSDKLEVGGATFTQVKSQFDALLKQDTWNGALTFEAAHPTIPLEGKGSFSFQPHRFINMKDIFLKGPDLQVSGDVLFAFPDMTAEGALFVQAQNLSHFSPLLPNSKLGGKLAGKIDFQELQASFHAIVQKFQCYEILSNELSIDGFVTDLLSSPKGKFSLEGQTTYVSHFFFDFLSLMTWWEKEEWPFLLSGKGKWKDPLEFQAAGSFRVQAEEIDFHLSSLHGTMLQKPVYLQKPFSVNYSDKMLTITECQLELAEGYFLGALNLSPTLCKVHLKAEHFPIDLFALGTSRFTLQGSSSVEIALEGSQDNLQGRINLLMEKGEILQSGKKAPIQTKGALQANLDKGIMQIHGGLAASEEQYFELTGSLPIAYQLYPLKIGIEKNKSLSGELTVEGHLEELFDFINIGSNRITGLLSGRLLLSHTLSTPRLLGTFEVQNGTYENYFTGMQFHDIQVAAHAEGHRINFTSIEGKDDDKGITKGTGTLALEEKFPFTFEGVMQDMKILHLDWLSASGSGPVKITGNTDSAIAQGQVAVSHADIRIPDKLPIDLPILPVTYVNGPSYLRHTVLNPEPAYPFHYDTKITAEGNIFLTGRGLNCELEGNLHVSGKNLSADVTGSLRLLKGKFSFAGKDFTLTNGELSFSPSAYLNITGTLTLPELTVTAMLRGPLSAPQLTFQSNPSMPTSSILAQILFNKDISELSAAQALQLADTIVTLSGGAGPGVLETIRKSLGIDRLNIASSGDSEQVSVQIGKYLTRGVMVTLSQSTQSSQIIVEVELKGGFVLQAETQEDEQGKFSFKWNKNY